VTRADAVAPSEIIRGATRSCTDRAERASSKAPRSKPATPSPLPSAGRAAPSRSTVGAFDRGPEPAAALGVAVEDVALHQSPSAADSDPGTEGVPRSGHGESDHGAPGADRHRGPAQHSDRGCGRAAGALQRRGIDQGISLASRPPPVNDTGPFGRRSPVGRCSGVAPTAAARSGRTVGDAAGPGWACWAGWARSPALVQPTVTVPEQVFVPSARAAVKVTVSAPALSLVKKSRSMLPEAPDVVAVAVRV
jgi:hypothetical protein